MRRRHKIRNARRLWAATQTLPDIASLMARWLEGDLATRPGYTGSPDEETAPYIPTLAAANRAGFLTDQSQPGHDGTGFDRLRWQQRAAVSGLTGDETLLTRIRRAGEAAGLLVLISHPRLLPQGRGATCTLRGGQPYTRFGEYTPPRMLRHLWSGIGHQALRQVADAWQVCLIDPDIGRNDRLWPLLDHLFAARPVTA